MTDYKDLVAGGPAFPRQSGTTDMGGAMGMTLRDWFAGQIISGLLASAYFEPEDPQTPRDAYRIADLMLKERAK